MQDADEQEGPEAEDIEAAMPEYMELDNNTVIMQARNTVILKRASLTHTLKATLDTLTADDFHSIMATYRKEGPTRPQVQKTNIHNNL